MAKEVTINTWCDPHLDLGEHVTGEEIPPLPVDGKPKTVAYCKECRSEFYDPFMEQLAKYGQDPDTAPSIAGVPQGKTPCPECGKPFKNLGVHRARAHGWVPENGKGGKT